jgi:hypothetical protein
MILTKVLNSGCPGSCSRHESQWEATAGMLGLWLTTHLSNESARAFEDDTSRDSPLRFAKMSCSVSKLVWGGGICRLNGHTGIVSNRLSE